MIVYANRHRVASTRELLQQISGLSDALERRIALGEWEAGVTDALFPDQEQITPLVHQMRELSLAQPQGDPGFLKTFDLPETIEIHVPEGFAFYSLYPRQYQEAAREFLRTCKSAPCWVIGIRSIGTTLSGIVGHELRQAGWAVESFTVRPHGHPFDRFISLHPDLEEKLRQRKSDWFVIVDEGPGLSGSSFASVAAKLSELGIADNRIVLFPSWKGDADSFRSEKARHQWPRHRKFVGSFSPEQVLPKGAIDISAGQWRALIYPSQSELPAVHPQHERRKYLVDGSIWKFAGLGNYGRAKLERARILSEAGFIPPIEDLQQGFTISRFVSGDPLVSGDQTPNFIAHMAAYLALLKRKFTTSQAVSSSALRQMIEVNTGHLCPEPGNVIEDVQTVALDGRMLPQEWIQTPSGWLKTDALDHHDDHFFPGCQDIAWDLAGACVEFRMQPEECEHLVNCYLAMEQDPTLRQRLPFYKVAYTAYRYGYVTLAQQSLAGSEEEPRFAEQKNYYTDVLKAMGLPIASQA